MTLNGENGVFANPSIMNKRVFGTEIAGHKKRFFCVTEVLSTFVQRREENFLEKNHDVHFSNAFRVGWLGDRWKNWCDDSLYF